MQEKMRDFVMGYIVFRHPETGSLIGNSTWTGGKTTPPNIVGSETYQYYSGRWNFTMSYPVVPNPRYNISVKYYSSWLAYYTDIEWHGSWQNWYVNETEYHVESEGP